MGWFSKKNKSTGVESIEKATRPADEQVKIGKQELETLKHKAAEYDRLTSGETGQYLRRNGIIK